VDRLIACLLLFTLFLSCASVQAGTGQSFTYQGRLQDQGQPANGLFDLDLGLYDTSADGSPLSQVALSEVPVEDGVFTVELNFGDGLFDGGARFLQIAVRNSDDPEGTPFDVLQPRQRLTATPYALYALEAVSHDHDDIYFTKGESDARFVNASGDAMSGVSADPIISVTQTGTGASAYFSSTASHGVHGETASSDNGVAGVRGTAGLPGTAVIGKHGVLGESDAGKGVTGVSRDGNGVYGWSTNSWAIRAEGQFGGVSALSWAVGSDTIRGENTATSGSSWGVVGTSGSPSGRGIVGINNAATGTAEGVFGQSSSTGGRGVSGLASAVSGSGVGVYGQNNSSSNGAGVRGESPYVGVWGSSSGPWGVYGSTTASGGYGVAGVASGSNGRSIYGYNAGAGGYAGYFQGNVQVNGTLSKSSGTFKIDHPLDPENKYLNHSFVESPDMMNVYNGNVTLDANGEAWIDLSTYFEALNRDFRYQLTPIGGPGPNLYIAEEVENNRFQIAGGAPGLRVSWQVTGIRQDPYARANPVVVEQEKPAEERGTYLFPEGYGHHRSRGVDYKSSQQFGPLDEKPGTARSAGINDKPAIE